ncbi:MAG TPA: LeuA family protein [Thermoanaerobaculia bacterium]|jgi:2-isopropylmalate synthase
MDRAPTNGAMVFDWAAAGPHRFTAPPVVMVNDETLRDGLQSPSATDPPIGAKIEILHLMDELGIDAAAVGLPGAGERQRQAAELLCREIAASRLRIRPNCAGRTIDVDVAPIAELSQRTGVAVEACLFIGGSPIRQYVEGWTVDTILRRLRGAIELAVREGLEVMFVTEDTTRSAPEHLRLFFTAAVEAGAKRLCLTDTAGAAIPEGALNLVAWARSLLDELGVDVGIDWHGHRDRALDLANTLAAIRGGATRVHGTALGIGERTGNTPIEQILVNLKLLGLRDGDLSRLPDYAEAVSRAVGVPFAANTPIVGRDAFRTGTGVHAAAVIKAFAKGDHDLADRVYSGVPASWVGRRQEILVGPMSGASNVHHFLRAHGLPDDGGVVEAVLARAKQSARVLTEEELLEVVRGFGAGELTVHPAQPVDALRQA